MERASLALRSAACDAASMLMLALMLQAAAADAAPQTMPAPAPAAGTLLDAVPPVAAGETETLTRIRYKIDVEGRVSDCTIVESDAPEAIQQTICQTFTERARLKPKLKDGKPVAGTEEKTVRFRARADGAPEPTLPPVSVPSGDKRKLPEGR